LHTSDVTLFANVTNFDLALDVREMRKKDRNIAKIKKVAE